VEAQALAVSIGSASEGEIDRLNILRATLLAMERALGSLTLRPDLVLIDGNQTLPLGVAQRALVRGDSLSAAIAAASNVAKVHRTRLMVELARDYPGYGFEVHDGYGTEFHKEALRTLGPCPAHRSTFLEAPPRQLSLFPSG
jgi:ribonuclease HII